MATPSKAELLMLLKNLESHEQETRFLRFFEDRNLYPKHHEFMASGLQFRQRNFIAANRIGKSTVAECELTMHLTGIYPDWWTGKKFTRAQDWWVVCVDSDTIKATVQPALLGKIGEFGTGFIPKSKLDFSTLKDATKSDTLVSSFRVKHKSGKFSTVEFKSAQSGRAAFQGSKRSIWIDEECPEDIYVECLARTMDDSGIENNPEADILMMTFTPLKGLTPVIKNFYGEIGFTTESKEVGEGKFSVNATWDDAPHLSDADKKMLWASIPPYQREARSKGMPSLGSGVIYPVPESTYVIEPIQIPKHWKKMYGLDVGWKRTAAVWLAIDPDTNLIYVYSEHYMGEAEPSVHAAAIRARGEWIPGVIDSAANGRTQTDGENLMQMYKDLGLKIQNADKAVESGIYTVWQLLSQGQIKVFSTCTNFMNEIRLYRRDEKGKIVKENDHLMDSWRYAIMGRDIATTELKPGGTWNFKPGKFIG